MTTQTSTFPLRLPLSLKSEVEKMSEAEGTSMNQFLVVAVAEKLAAMKTETFFAQARTRADHKAFLKILNRKGGVDPSEEDRL